MNAKSYKGHYALQWALLSLLLSAVLLFHKTSTPFVFQRILQSITTHPVHVDWFYIIKLPEITTQHESGVDTMKIRIKDWLQTLKTQGFHPMLLSDAIRDIQNGHGVPERTVVSFFSPGYRRTFEIVSPILAQEQWPAVWLTDETGMKHADRRLVTYHTTRQMKESYLWDIAFDQGGKRFRLESPRGETIHFGSAQGPSWSPSSGAFALNHGASLHNMNFLTVNSSWLASELLSRLLVETPPGSDFVYLTKGEIQGREWGMTLPSSQIDINPRFDLKAPLNRRGSRLFFLGTKGIPNFRLHVDSPRLVGEFWVQLRIDDVEGYGINVIYTDKAVFVVQQVQQSKTRLSFGSHAVSRNGKGFTEDISLTGEQLSVSLNNGTPLVVNNLRPPVPERGIVQIYLADKPHGTARADSVLITFSPLASRQ